LYIIHGLSGGVGQLYAKCLSACILIPVLILSLAHFDITCAFRGTGMYFGISLVPSTVAGAAAALGIILFAGGVGSGIFILPSRIFFTSAGGIVGGYIILVASRHAAAMATFDSSWFVVDSGGTVGGIVIQFSMPLGPPLSRVCTGMSSGPTAGMSGNTGIAGGGGGGGGPRGGKGTAGGISSFGIGGGVGYAHPMGANAVCIKPTPACA